MTAGAVLVVGPSWVGDMVMAQSLFKALKNRNTATTIDVLAPAWSRPILALMPEVRLAVDMPVGHGEIALGQRFRIGRGLANSGYEQAIVLPNSFKSALIPWFAGIPKRTGWTGEARFGLLNDRRKLDETAVPLMVQRFVALAGDDGGTVPSRVPVPALVTDSEQVLTVGERFLGEEVRNEQPRPLLALCPGAEFGSAKQWPPDYFAAVAAHYLGAGWRVMLLGSVSDTASCAEVQQQASSAGSCLNLAGKTSLDDAVQLLSLASLAVSNDSGLMHIAAAVGTPTVAVYGATSPDFTPPLADHAAVVQQPIDCSPCFKRECPLGHHRCMKELSPQMVIDAAERLVPCAS